MDMWTEESRLNLVGALAEAIYRMQEFQFSLDPIQLDKGIKCCQDALAKHWGEKP